MTTTRLAAFKERYPMFNADTDLCRGIFEVFCNGAVSRDAEIAALNDENEALRKALVLIAQDKLP